MQIIHFEKSAILRRVVHVSRFANGAKPFKRAKLLRVHARRVVVHAVHSPLVAAVKILLTAYNSYANTFTHISLCRTFWERSFSLSLLFSSSPLLSSLSSLSPRFASKSKERAASRKSSKQQR